MEKVLGDRALKTDPGAVALCFLLTVLIGWGITDILFEHGLLSICGGVITAGVFGWPAYRSAMKYWGDKV
ncbi:hypothetical protein JHV56_05180 [Arthrobacter sp. BHU FT2]|nr:hypothetical protein [Arthrobacter sp. BHU FT2]